MSQRHLCRAGVTFAPLTALLASVWLSAAPAHATPDPPGDSVTSAPAGSFLTLDRLDAQTRVGTDLVLPVHAQMNHLITLGGALVRTQKLFARTAVGGLGLYGQFPWAVSNFALLGSNRQSQSELHGLLGLDLGGYLDLRPAPPLELVLRAGLSPPKLSDALLQETAPGQLGAWLVAQGRPGDLAALLPGTFVRLSASSLLVRGPWTLRADLGVDLPTGDTLAPVWLLGRAGLGALLQLQRVGLSLELVNAWFYDGSDSGASVHTLTTSVLLGRVQLALSVPLLQVAPGLPLGFLSLGISR